MHVDLTPAIAGRLALAAALGGVIGLERELHRKAAGLRTSMLICMGACFFMLISIAAATHPEDDHTRIAAQIIAGIGFIGAGVILRERGNVVGLTTAATVWVEAAVGMGVGLGMYLTALYATGVALLALTALGWAERWFGIKTHILTFRVSSLDGEDTLKKARQIFSELKITVQHSEFRRVGNESVGEFDAEVSVPQEHELMRRLSTLPARCETVHLDLPHES